MDRIIQHHLKDCYLKFRKNCWSIRKLKQRNDFIWSPLFRMQSTEVAGQKSGAKALVQMEQVYTRPFEDVPGPRLPPWFKSSWVAGPLQQGHSSSSRLIQPYLRLFGVYGPLVRIGKDSLLVSHPRQIARILSFSRPERSAFGVMERKRISTQPVHMPEYELDFSDLAKKYAQDLEYKPNHFNKTLEEVSDMFISRLYWYKNLQHEVPEFDYELYKWALECTFECVFSKDFHFLFDEKMMTHDLEMKCSSTQIMEMFKSATKTLITSETGPLGAFWAESHFSYYVDILHGILCRHVREKYLKLPKEPLTKFGILDRMILKDKMRSSKIINILLELVIIGIPIAAHTVGFIIYHLSRDTKVQGKLYDEVKTFNMANVRELPLLKYIIAETLRLHPPFPYFSRRLDCDVILHGYGVPMGTEVHLINEVANLQKDLFPRPREFQPARWEGESGLAFSHTYNLLPIKEFAPLITDQISILVAKLCEVFKFEYHYGKISSRGRVLAAPRRPFRFTFIERTRFL